MQNDNAFKQLCSQICQTQGYRVRAPLGRSTPSFFEQKTALSFTQILWVHAWVHRSLVFATLVLYVGDTEYKGAVR
eukprot:COSAG02_NODE_39671_length_414_cov_0.815873_1_plen_75_part_10